MKYLFTILAALLLSANGFAQGYLRFNYQAVIRNTAGNLLVNQPVALRISILEGTATGPAAYVETHTPTTNANGLVNLEIGGGSLVSGNFFSLIWPQGAFFLKTEVDPLGGTNYTIVGTTQLLSVPYAMHAQTATRVQEHFIGEFFGGGIVFNTWRDYLGVQHGLIASLDDLADARGHDASTSVASPALVGTSYDNGATNTAAIISALSGPTAAAVCRAYNAGTFTDWYLPAVWELQLLYNQAFTLTSILATDNNAATNGFLPSATRAVWYWSSTDGAAQPATPTTASPTSYGIPFTHEGDYTAYNSGGTSPDYFFNNHAGVAKGFTKRQRGRIRAVRRF